MVDGHEAAMMEGFTKLEGARPMMDNYNKECDTPTAWWTMTNGTDRQTGSMMGAYPHGLHFKCVKMP